MAYRYGTPSGALAKMFDAEQATVEPTPALDERINVLLVGIDATRFRVSSRTR